MKWTWRQRRSSVAPCAFADDGYSRIVGVSYSNSESLHDAFRNTIVTIEVNGSLLEIDPKSPPYELPWTDAAYVITAWNPGEPLPDEENRRRNIELRQELVDRDYSIFDAVGRSPDGRWEEWGFAVIGADRAEAVALGQRFGQLAIFELTTTSLAVLSC
jgi:hypothetical protein